MKNATKILIKRGERRRRLPPASLPVDEGEREAGEVVGREREKERERIGRFETKMEEGVARKKKRSRGLGSAVQNGVVSLK